MDELMDGWELDGWVRRDVHSTTNSFEPIYLVSGSDLGLGIPK